MKKINKNLYQFSQYNEVINISTHQYLLLSAQPTLMHAGTYDAAAENIPEIEKLLAGRELCHIIVAHLGADECGGLAPIVKRWPNAKVHCSQHVAKELPGFGIRAEMCEEKSGSALTGEDFSIKFIDYPGDAHLQSGILAYDEVSGTFFSGDLMLRAGNGAGETLISNWHDEVSATGLRQVPNRTLLKQLRRELFAISPKFVAVGHGYFLKME